MRIQLRYGTFNQLISRFSRDPKEWVDFFSSHPDLSNLSFSQILSLTSLNHLVDCNLLTRAPETFDVFLLNRFDTEFKTNSKCALDSICGIHKSRQTDQIDADISNLNPVALHILFGANEELKTQLTMYAHGKNQAEHIKSFQNLLHQNLGTSPAQLRRHQEEGGNQF